MHWFMTSKRGLCWAFMSHRAAQNKISGSAPSNHILSGKDCQSHFAGHSGWSKMNLAGDSACVSLTCTWGRSEVPRSQCSQSNLRLRGSSWCIDTPASSLLSGCVSRLGLGTKFNEAPEKLSHQGKFGFVAIF